MKLIVGLGNPGKGYEYTRHNLGFFAVRYIAEQLDAKLKLCSFTKAISAETKVEGKDIFLLLPMTYMNNSGVAVKRFMEAKEVNVAEILVICDDFNLDFGQIRLRQKGSDGGHNGLSSIIYHLQDEQFSRLRMGIGSPKPGVDTADFVLEEFNGKEKQLLQDFIKDAADCCSLWLKGDINKAMEQYNRRKGNGQD